MFQIPLAGQAYQDDNKAVFQMLKEYLVGTVAYAWIKANSRFENGRAAYLDWDDHYNYNGQGELIKQTNLVKLTIRTIHYKNESAFSFELFAFSIDAPYACTNSYVENFITLFLIFSIHQDRIPCTPHGSSKLAESF